MSTLSYGDVKMEMLGTRLIEQEQMPTKDGVDRNVTKWTLSAICYYNPAATSFAGTAIVSTATPGRLPAQTDAAIKEYLSQPRRTLIYADDLGNVIMRSPQPTFVSDAMYGPVVERCVVDQIHGSKTWRVLIRITTFVNEGSLSGEINGAQRSPVLTNRWTQTADYDEDYFMTRTTEGVATFRVDELLKLGHFPDQYRQDLFMVQPDNFKRELISVEALSDGTGVHYVYKDVEKPLNMSSLLLSRNITRIEAFHTGGYAAVSAARIIANQGVAMMGDLTTFLPNPLNGSIRASVEAAAQNIIRACPTYDNTCVVNIWGNRNATRGDMSAIAMAIAAQRVGGDFAMLGRSGSVSLTHDIMGKYIRFEVRHTWGIEQALANLVALAATPLSGINTIFNLFAGPAPAPPPLPQFGVGSFAATVGLASTFDNTGAFIGSGDVTGEPVGNPAFFTFGAYAPNSNYTRGTSLVNIIHQAFTAACAVPAPPPGVVQGGTPNPALTPIYTDRRIYP